MIHGIINYKNSISDMNSHSLHSNLLLSRASFEVSNIIKLGGHDTLHKPHYILLKNEQDKDNAIHNSHVRLCIDKEAALKDFPLFKWFKKMAEKKRKDKHYRSAKGIINSQAKANKTIKFTYTNLKGVKSTKEVDPYEIKGNYFWGLDRANREHIKKFIINKMENIKPGDNIYKPIWEVKLAMDLTKVANIRALLKNPAVVRGIEMGTGGLIGGIAGGVAASGEKFEHDKIEPIAKGIAAGITGALLVSRARRSNILKSIAPKRQARKWTRKKYDAAGNVLEESYPRSMKAIRAEADELKNPKLFKKYYKREFEDTASGTLDYAKETVRKKAAPNIKSKVEIKAFNSGFLNTGKPKKMTAEVSAAFAKGRTARGAFLSDDTIKALHRETEKLISGRRADIKKYIAYDDQPMILRIKRMLSKNPFGKLK